MLRSTLLFVIGLSIAACSQANVKEVTPAPVKTPTAPEVAEAPAPTAASMQFADIPWKPSNPKAPQGVMVHILSGNPKDGAFNAIVKVPAGKKIPLHSANLSLLS